MLTLKCFIPFAVILIISYFCSRWCSKQFQPAREKLVVSAGNNFQYSPSHDLEESELVQNDPNPPNRTFVFLISGANSFIRNYRFFSTVLFFMKLLIYRGIPPSQISVFGDFSLFEKNSSIFHQIYYFPDRKDNLYELRMKYRTSMYLPYPEKINFKFS